MTPLTLPAMRFSPEEVWFPCSLDVLGWDEHFHQLMLNDHLRMTVYREGVNKAVRPGDVVLDLGTGTGILAKWALEAGAARVYGVEVNGKILDMAKQRLAADGLADRFIPVHALSWAAELPEKVDLVISELIGNFGDNEDCHRILADARMRFLKPGGRMLPERVVTYAVPVCSPEAHRQIETGQCRAISETYDLRKLLARLGLEDPFEIYYDVVLPETTYLSRPKQARLFDFASGSAAEAYRISLKFPVETGGLLTGFKGYFLAELTGGVRLDISGADISGRTASDSWKHCYLPLRSPFLVRPGQTVAFTIERSPQQDQASPFAFRYKWQAEIEGADVPGN